MHFLTLRLSLIAEALNFHPDMVWVHPDQCTESLPALHPCSQVVSSHGSSLVVVYQPPTAAYTQFVSEFLDFLSSFAASTDKVIIVGDFKIHMDEDTDSVKTAFISLLCFSHLVNEPSTAIITPWIWFSAMD